MKQYRTLLKSQFDEINKFVKLLLDLTSSIVTLKQLPSTYVNQDVPEFSAAMAKIPTTAYWIIKGIVLCMSHAKLAYQYAASSIEAWKLPYLAKYINGIHDHLKKQLDTCNQLIEQVNLEVLRKKTVLWLISSLDISLDELSILEQIYIESSSRQSGWKKLDNLYDIVWIPIVDQSSMQWTESMQNKFESIQSTMPWYTVQHPSLIGELTIKFIKEHWHFSFIKPIMVVLDPQGKVVNSNAFHIIWLWGSNAFPFTTLREEALWEEQTWRLEFLVNGFAGDLCWRLRLSLGLTVYEQNYSSYTGLSWTKGQKVTHFLMQRPLSTRSSSVYASITGCLLNHCVHRARKLSTKHGLNRCHLIIFFPFLTIYHWKIHFLNTATGCKRIGLIADGRYILVYGGNDMEWIRRLTTTARHVGQDARIPLEMVYVGKSSSKKEQIQRVNATIRAEKLSNTWMEDMIWFFWIRLESMLFSKIKLERVNNNDPLTNEIKKLLGYDKSGEGWAVLSKGSDVLINGHGTTVLTTLLEYEDTWKEKVDIQGFQISLKDHHDMLHRIEQRCCRFEVTSTATMILETMKCPDCLRTMEKHMTFVCCHDDQNSTAAFY
ncbi:hypothetical protein HYC85_023489 [Camellia sinensis]|uniref:Sieve element occlusion C-terminal domain-containing protein n=1 Tax=Camellia sinensis TaxID=4442 RepID=A0A7J7GES4_CAMSI|nr:hypothetical protein HYC85_023489 [Camellia sinensis]